MLCLQSMVAGQRGLRGRHAQLRVVMVYRLERECAIDHNQVTAVKGAAVMPLNRSHAQSEDVVSSQDNIFIALDTVTM